MTTKIIKKAISPFKKAIKWYFNKLAESGTYIYVTGMFPPEYCPPEYYNNQNSNKKSVK